MKVLIAVDGSAGSFEAVDQIGRVLSAERDQVALYCSPPDVRLRSHEQDAKLAARAMESIAEAIFEEAGKRLPEPLASRVHKIVGDRDARREVVLEAEAWSADMIAVGARGLSTLERLLLGSVSRTIVHRSSIPVWVARARPQAARPSFNVLLACENPEHARPAADVLSRLSWPAGSMFSTVSVVQSLFAGRVPDWLEQQARGPEVEAMVQAWAREHAEELHSCQARMADFVHTLPAPLSGGRTLVVEGEPAREILGTIHRERVDVVVIGSEHKRTVANLILGRTSDAVLNHAGCSVLIVPHRDGAAA